MILSFAEISSFHVAVLSCTFPFQKTQAWSLQTESLLICLKPEIGEY